jgi:hypothetical protein
MHQTKTRLEREKELQALIRTPQGRAALEELARSCQADGGTVRPERTSVITYILVHERQLGLIVN